VNDPDGICSIGQRLREERERLKFSQASLANVTLVSKLTQLKYESGQSTPSASYLAQFARLGGDVLYIVTGMRTPAVKETSGEPVVLSEEEASLLDNYHHADKDDQAAARRILFAFSKQKAA
jgi:transcriptional regulator with XRE-family HTH domain